MSPRLFLVLSLAVCGTALTARGQSADERAAALEARLQKVEAELAQYKSAQAQVFSDEYRAALIDQIVKDVKARAAADGIKGGYANGFFIASGNNDFQLKLNGLVQARYLYNHNDVRTGDEDESGFTNRRSELYLNGNAFGKALTFQLSGGFNGATGNFGIVSAFAGYQLTKELQLQAGIFKGPFLSEELTAAGKQQAVERSYFNAYFTAGTTEGFQLQYVKNNLRMAVMAHDGSNAVNSDFNADKTDWGVASRVEYKLLGEWAQFADFSGWADSKPAARLGAAIDYESAENGDSTSYPDTLKYTADLMLKGPGWNVFLAGVGRCNMTGGTAVENASQFGAMAQAGVFVIPNRLELFGRYEYIYLDGFFSPGTAAIDNQLNLGTLGANWYFIGHNAKITTDFVYLFDALPAANTGVGLLTSEEGGQGVFRVSFQVMF